jgi:multicomponent Na+:H+ antiporter subunit B
MNSLILRTASVYLHPLLLVFSVFLLLRGHNEPGGGFVGGLVAAAAFCLQMIAFDVQTARRMLGADPRLLVALGLLMAVVAGLFPLLGGKPFLTGIWFDLSLLGMTKIHLGSPLLFDLGVYNVVIGVTLLLVFSFAEEEESP